MNLKYFKIYLILFLFVMMGCVEMMSIEPVNKPNLNPRAVRVKPISTNLSDASHDWGNYYALIVGINNYDQKQWKPLKTAVWDAEELAQVLRRQYGFSRQNIKLLINDDATRGQFLSDLGGMVEKLSAEDWTKEITIYVGRLRTEKAYLQLKRTKLFVHCEPTDAQVRFVNPPNLRYIKGMELDAGYYLEIAKAGYETEQKQINILAGGGDKHLGCLLKKDEPDEPLVSFTAAPTAWTEPTTNMQFVWVPKGCFQMGSNDGDSDEKPVHEVCVDGFWMGKYEVTVGQFKKFLQDSEYNGNGTNIWQCDGMADPQFSQ
ncbi:hypothetical protein GMMP15_1280002 [Candidatus Magnetomoraceae bacterium gMMP-15]